MTSLIVLLSLLLLATLVLAVAVWQIVRADDPRRIPGHRPPASHRPDEFGLAVRH